jgi:hypothetical protein
MPEHISQEQYESFKQGAQLAFVELLRSEQVNAKAAIEYLMTARMAILAGIDRLLAQTEQ